jgi:uncharacterized glyoxalase superfamily protein PhnB
VSISVTINRSAPTATVVPILIEARIKQAPHDMPFGERQHTALDHSGHWWTFSQHIADVAPEEWGTVSAR